MSMRISRVVFVIASFLIFSNSLYSQPWLENATDAEGKLNFFMIRENAEKYWENRPIEKGKGFKPYKRWEYYWQYRVNPDGSFPDSGITEKNWKEYLLRNQGKNRVNEANWESIGPSLTNGGYAGIGRVNCVAFHPTDPDIIWIGAPGGGLWKTTDGGATWITTFDQSVVLGVSGILIDPKKPNIMYIATGDGDASDTYSTGVLKSIDGGVTWQTTGLNWNVSQTRVIRRIIFQPENSSILFAATSNGLYRTLDSGENWTQVLTGNFFDVKANPNSFSNIVYAATGSTVQKSIDNGATFTIVQNISGANRIALGVSNANSGYLYALASNGSGNGFLGFYQSVDTAKTFTLKATTPNLLGWDSDGGDSGGQGWYDLCLAVDPTDPEVVYTGGVNVWKSTNGGTAWSLRTHWSGASGVQTVHADQHCMEWQNPTTLWLGNDGGIYKSTNGGVNWSDKSNGLIISQMYKLGVSQADAKVITGLQDNGTKLKGTSGTWNDVIGGDGMECAIRPDNASVMYGSLYYGAIRRSTNGGSSWTSIKPSNAGDGAWVTPFVLDPNASQTIYAGFKRVYKSTNQGTNWTALGSSNLNSSALNYLHVAKANSSVIYAGRGSSLYRTTNGGTNWSTMTVPGSNTVMLAIHPDDADMIWAVRSNYTAGQKVYKSEDGGATWINVSGTLPNLPVNCILFDESTNKDGLYIGMDVGVFYRDNDMEDWELFSTGLPNTPVFELEIKYDTDEIFAATYGRGLWKSVKKYNGTFCRSVSGITIDEMGIDSARISWSASDPVPVNGYQYGFSTNTTPPLNWSTSFTTEGIIYGLSSNSKYYFFVRSVCEESLVSSWQSAGPFYTQLTCDDISTDTGGSSAEYSDNENIIRSICPDIELHYISITFTDFDVETDWDALYIFDGKSTSDPMFSSGNPETDAGFPAGGYYGTDLPGTFTSTHSSGCLTLQFMSDGYVTGDGWEANADCIPECNATVLIDEDDGYGSFRNVVLCADPGQSIVFAPEMANDTIHLDSPVIIDQDMTIVPEGMTLTLQADHDHYIFEVLPGVTLTLGNISLIGGTGANQTRVILNRGNLQLLNVQIIDVLAGTGLGKTISNEGTLDSHGSIQISSE
ncbi:MAG TPA: hypothetical protein DCX89_00720 [Saprospirales bacterium]|nr:hypothetical protein [Saprospirales bacterium]